MTLLGFGPTGWGGALLMAAGVTVVLSMLGFVLGTLVGSGVAAMRLSASRILRVIADVYVTVFRGVPDLLTIYLLYYGGDTLYKMAYAAAGGTETVGLPSFEIGVVALGLISGAYQSEVFRGAYLAIDRGQIQAAHAFGLNGATLFRRIIVPQVLRFALPSLGNVWQLILKDSALVSVIGVAELMRQTFIGAGSTRRPIEFYLAGALLYFIIAWVTGKGFRGAETYAMRGVRRA